MDIKYIKVGKWYNVPFKVVEIKSGDIHMENGGIKAVCQPSELSEITARQDVRSEHSTVSTLSYPERVWNDLCYGQKHAADLSQAMRNHIKSMNPDTENGTKNTETAPKYDPNRPFREGDRVYPIELNGRIFSLYWKNKIGKLLTVTKSESFDYVELPEVDGQPIDPAYLRLVTPVEELEPYYVKNIIRGHAVYERGAGDLAASCVFWSKYHPNAKAAAEAERDRLNAEYREEMGK